MKREKRGIIMASIMQEFTRRVRITVRFFVVAVLFVVALGLIVWAAVDARLEPASGGHMKFVIGGTLGVIWFLVLLYYIKPPIGR